MIINISHCNFVTIFYRNVLSNTTAVTLLHDIYRYPNLFRLSESNDMWLKSGCSVHLTNKTHTVCHCFHLTNFALLMDIHGVEVSRKFLFVFFAILLQVNLDRFADNKFETPCTVKRSYCARTSKHPYLHVKDWK